jgi:hypothetical protein
MYANYFVHEFLIASIIIFLILILYFNYDAYKTNLQNKVIDVLRPLSGCTYPNLNLIPDSSLENNLYTITVDKINFSLSTVPTSFTDVCKSLCNNYDNLTTTCNDKNVNPLYNTCINILQPIASCQSLASPLGYRFKNNDKVNFYAKNILTTYNN